VSEVADSGDSLTRVLRLGRQFGLALALVAATCTADAGHLRKVWEFNLDGVASAPSIGVFALSFSPDGRRILAVAGKSWRDEFVVILDTSAPQGYKNG